MRRVLLSSGGREASLRRVIPLYTPMEATWEIYTVIHTQGGYMGGTYTVIHTQGGYMGGIHHCYTQGGYMGGIYTGIHPGRLLGRLIYQVIPQGG